MLNYGFQRLALIGSAGYQRAELPLDDSVSLIAPNNHGKTSLINALQFLLIIDKRRMDFGSHSLDKARRFYFPNNSAYILLEAVLPQSGTVVFGCVGKGVGHDYEYFAYQGELDIDDYRLDDGNMVTQPKLVNHLASKGHIVYRYNDKEFRHLIYGGAKSKKTAEVDFTVFKLENLNDARPFQQVLTKTLRLDKLNSSDVKEYLLKIFRRDQANASVDFKQEWEKAFHDINIEREQYLAVEQNLPLIQVLENKFERNLALRGKIIACQPQINELLHQWHDYTEDQARLLAQEKSAIEQQQNDLQQQDRVHVEKRSDLKNQIAQILQIERQQQELVARFALIPDQQYLENQRELAQRAYDVQAALYVNSQRYSPQSLSKQLAEAKARLVALQGQHKTLGNNLYLYLANFLDSVELEKLNKVFSSQMMQLSPEHYAIDIDALHQLLKHGTQEQFVLSGLSVSLVDLIPQHVQKTEQELVEEIQTVNEQLDELNKLLETSKEIELAENKKSQLERAVKECAKDLVDYQQLQTLLKEQDQRTKLNETLSDELKSIENELTNANQKSKVLAEKCTQTVQKAIELATNNDKVSKLKANRIDDQAIFTALAEQLHTPWFFDEDWSLEYLPARFEHYNAECRELDSLTKELRQMRHDLVQKGLTKFQMAQTQDEELKSIIQFSQCLDEEKKALERRARSAVVTVTASLRELRDGLRVIQTKMREFNRLISHRQLSDLKTFKIAPMEEEPLVNAMNVLIQQAEQTDSGQSFDLFDQASILDDVELERAKTLLIEEGNARQGLRVSDLFRLEFVVAKQGQPEESFEDIDSAASNGTVLMAKLVTGLAMLHLMQDKRHNMKAVCYLDEALALDTKNQANLIEIAQQFGFSLIFASPAPLTTARYCVPIHQANGKNHISRNSWQIFESLEHSTVDSSLEAAL
ncbi:hypothetical protein [Photobacterium nomapromontoriensis]|uniref:hypothetical protein n=1 Tax=Photobacterium nomapromontoriensis TaxID=2910237 RepID=UPI003D0AE0EF